VRGDMYHYVYSSPELGAVIGVCLNSCAETGANVIILKIIFFLKRGKYKQY
jgi:hypothetical protein